ncbi:MAG: hypothetical protein LQ339_000858 [Xanthoria mediterranea]|nr:MAG: hypothetical protein LQ339_000858 [Xanthoria mediterranea]
MVLVDYSESEGSEVEDKQKSSKVPKPLPNPTKPAFQKVVDRSNPHKIRVNLPELDKDSAEVKEDEEGPPSKRAKMGGGSFGGFNSFLPAPKRATATNGTGSVRGGLGSGVNLKTGATPGFSREPMPEYSRNTEEDADIADGGDLLKGTKHPREDISIGTNGPPEVVQPRTVEKSTEKTPKQGNAMMFKPLSVARKPQKKKTAVPVADATLAQKHATPSSSSQAKPAPKLSLFSTDIAQNDHINDTTSNGTYQPMIYGIQEPEDPAAKLSRPREPYMDDPVAAEEPVAQSDFAQRPQSLDNIASDLNLSASAKRQLLGRQNRNASAINVVNFNTDQEYAANEVLRQAGEQAQHNPVRAIAPGKHSLKQLVNAASNQKDALEEQFASGRRNKKEAGSKYGW